jgi:hypothetical protein
MHLLILATVQFLPPLTLPPAGPNERKRKKENKPPPPLLLPLSTPHMYIHTYTLWLSWLLHMSQRLKYPSSEIPSSPYAPLLDAQGLKHYAAGRELNARRYLRILIYKCEGAKTDEH